MQVEQIGRLRKGQVQSNMDNTTIPW